jgi:mono/diheme cytochrome c family protein
MKTMIRTRSQVLTAAVLGWLVVGCSAGGPDEAVAPALPEADARAARALFEEESCTMCHGPEAEGTDLAPALHDLRGYWDEDRLVHYLEDPAAFAREDPTFDARRETVYEMEMPAYAHVPESDRRTLARWLLSR